MEYDKELNCYYLFYSLLMQSLMVMHSFSACSAEVATFITSSWGIQKALEESVLLGICNVTLKVMYCKENKNSFCFQWTIITTWSLIGNVSGYLPKIKYDTSQHLSHPIHTYHTYIYIYLEKMASFERLQANLTEITYNKDTLIRVYRI